MTKLTIEIPLQYLTVIHSAETEEYFSTQCCQTKTVPCRKVCPLVPILMGIPNNMNLTPDILPLQNHIPLSLPLIHAINSFGPYLSPLQEGSRVRTTFLHLNVFLSIIKVAKKNNNDGNYSQLDLIAPRLF